MATISRKLWPTKERRSCATIAPRMSHDGGSIKRRSQDDRAAIAMKFAATNQERPSRDVPSDRARLWESWPTTHSMISFIESLPMKIQRPSCNRVSPMIPGHDPRLAHVSPVRWRSNHRDVSTRFLGEFPSDFILAVEFNLKLLFYTCLDGDRRLRV